MGPRPNIASKGMEYPDWLFSAEAGYVSTSIAMVQAAMILLNDASDLPKA